MIKLLKNLFKNKPTVNNLITNELIANLKPCKNRYDNYLKYYKGKSFTKQQFMGLKNITHDDKVWVSLKLVPKDSLRFIAADIAESVLDLYEIKFPNDDRPRKSIEAARSNSMSLEEKRNATNAAIDAASTATYAVFVYDTDDSVYYGAIRAAYAAVYAAICNDTVYSTAITNNVAVDAAEDEKAQQKLIRKIILKYWK